MQPSPQSSRRKTGAYRNDPNCPPASSLGGWSLSGGGCWLAGWWLGDWWLGIIARMTAKNGPASEPLTDLIKTFLERLWSQSPLRVIGCSDRISASTIDGRSIYPASLGRLKFRECRSLVDRRVAQIFRSSIFPSVPPLLVIQSANLAHRKRETFFT